jgi:ubiquinone/menaquinone biosynthesis C-methylase UbiE
MAGRTAKTVVGADISEEAIAYCKANYRQPNMKFEVGDVRSLSYADKSFDAVTCFETIEHVVDGNAVMREVARVLKDDGTALISTPLGGPCGNEYHVAYYQRGTFEVILRQFFDDVVVNYQRNETFQSQSISPEYADTFTGEYAMALCRKPVRGEG